MTNEDTAKQSLSSPQPKAEDEFEKLGETLKNEVREICGIGLPDEACVKIVEKLKAQILKEDKEKECICMRPCRGILLGGTCGRKQKEEKQNPLSGLSIEQLELVSVKLSNFPHNKRVMQCKDIINDILDRREKQLSKESKVK